MKRHILLHTALRAIIASVNSSAVQGRCRKATRCGDISCSRPFAIRRMPVRSRLERHERPEGGERILPARVAPPRRGQPRSRSNTRHGLADHAPDLRVDGGVAPVRAVGDRAGPSGRPAARTPASRSRGWAASGGRAGRGRRSRPASAPRRPRSGSSGRCARATPSPRRRGSARRGSPGRAAPGPSRPSCRRGRSGPRGCGSSRRRRCRSRTAQTPQATEAPEPAARAARASAPGSRGCGS